MEIRILPGNIANMIAAGEVVQRPASVVKELVENAVDAGADQITVVITDAGRTLIQVIDNGCGMSPDEAVLCFERHATSKLATAEDLQHICTFGFRGEALASIAAVAEVTLKTRREEDEVGCQVEFADSKHLATEEVSAPRGCNFAVRNLFYNVPARRKFLKSDNVEFKHIIEEFTRVALTRPEIGFTLTHNGRDVYVLKPAKSLKFRIQDLLGGSAVDNVVDISADTSVVKVSGYISNPESARKTPGMQFFFVNGRFFRSPYLHKAVMNAYENLIPDGATPAYFIYLTVDPQTIDVNIHPTKTEIKFSEDSVIFQVLFACIREAIGRNSFGAAIDFDAPVSDIPVISRDYEKYRPADLTPDTSFDPGYNPFEPDTHSSAPVQDYSKYIDRREEYGRLFEEKAAPSSSVIIWQSKYILTPSRDGVLVVNIRRARERILYEKFIKSVEVNGHVSQSALFPVQVAVGAEHRLLFDEHEDLLHKLGFDISAFGTDTIVVNGVPEGFSCDSSKVEAMVADLVLILEDDSAGLAGIMEAAMAEKFARMGAAEGDNLTSSYEAQRLVDALFACQNPEYTPGGKKTMSLLSPEEIEKKF